MIVFSLAMLHSAVPARGHYTHRTCSLLSLVQPEFPLELSASGRILQAYN